MANLFNKAKKTAVTTTTKAKEKKVSILVEDPEFFTKVQKLGNIELEEIEIPGYKKMSSWEIIMNIIYDDTLKDDILDSLCHIVLEMLDQHSIFLQTGVKPITIDWIRRLDLNIFNN